MIYSEALTYAAMNMLRRNEGYRRLAYLDTAGKITVGYGRNLSDVGVSHGEADYLLLNDIGQALVNLSNYSFFGALNQARQLALIDMMVNLGPDRFHEFKLMIAALEVGDYERASDEMTDSLAAAEEPSRMFRNAAMMLRGEV